MLAFTDVTVPVDRSETAQRGVAAAIELTRTGSRLHFCSVVNASAALAEGSMGAPCDPEPVIAALRDDAALACADAVAAAERSGIAADSRVLFGPVIPAIRQFAAAHHSDAVVIGTHARTGAARVFFGSIAQGLMQTSDIPIVIAHADDAPELAGPVAVAFDGSAPAHAALDAAIQMARTRGRALAIVTVVEGGHSDWAASALLLGDAGDRVRAADVEFELVTMQGKAIETIVAAAERLASPLIVIGTRGHGGVARAIMGSVAAGVVERARVPVMVVHAP
jgi:nucleotide-binding universal stress UspA family protein